MTNFEIAEQVTANLNENGSFWEDKIIYPDDNYEHFHRRPITSNEFIISILPIIDSYLKTHSDKNIVNIICNLIEDMWTVIIYKWPKCFTKKELYNIETQEFDIIKYKYNPNFNICRIQGVASLSLIFAEISDKPDCINIFKNILANSSILYFDWDSSSKFSNYNNAEHYKKLAEYIKGNIK